MNFHLECFFAILFYMKTLKDAQIERKYGTCRAQVPVLCMYVCVII